MVKPHVRKLLDDFAAAGAFARWEKETWKASDFRRQGDVIPGVAFYFHLPDGTVCDWPHIGCAENVVVMELVRMAKHHQGHSRGPALQEALVRYQQAEDIENPPVAWGSP